MSAFDAVDGSSTGTRVPGTWPLLRLPTIVVAARRVFAMIEEDLRWASMVASRRYPMDKIWDLVAGTFIAVSVFSGMTFIIVSAIR